LRKHHLAGWRKRLEEAPALVSRNKDGAKRTKVRAKSTFNRDMVPLRAALRQVLKLGEPNTDAAWQEALQPFKGADKRREIYINRNERKQIVECCAVEAEAFVRGLCMLPLGSGALAGLRVKDLDPRTRTLTIGKDKTGRPRQITVPTSISDFLKQQVKGKLPSAAIFARGGGRPWDKDSWKHPIKHAVKQAKLPGAFGIYAPA